MIFQNPKDVIKLSGGLLKCFIVIVNMMRLEYCFRLARHIQPTKKTSQNSNGDEADDADVDDADHFDDAGYI